MDPGYPGSIALFLCAFSSEQLSESDYPKFLLPFPSHFHNCNICMHNARNAIASANASATISKSSPHPWLVSLIYSLNPQISPVHLLLLVFLCLEFGLVFWVFGSLITLFGFVFLLIFFGIGMRDGSGGTMFAEADSKRRPRLGNITHSDPNMSMNAPVSEDDLCLRYSSASANGAAFCEGRLSCEGSPLTMSPWNQTTPFKKSPWTPSDDDNVPANSLIGSLKREEGHIYSLAASMDLLYTGSDSKNIRVWKNLKEFAGFKSNSGLVKAIVLSGEKIFTGHQDGKIRVWKVSPKNPSVHKRAGTLPTLKDIIKSSIKPSNYVEVKRKRSLWIKHSDAVSCLSLSEEQGLLYSASWDRTFKVWRISDSKCIESVHAHDDAVNSVVSSLSGMVFTGSADGTVKVWSREQLRKATKHTLAQTLLQQECAVTALAINTPGSALYCGSSEGLVNFWELEKQLSHSRVLKGHKLAVLCLKASENLVFTGSADKTICVWRRDGNIHTCLSVLTGHTGPVKCLAVEKDQESGKEQQWVVYSGSLDKSVKVWSVSEYAQVAAMQQSEQPASYDSESFPSDGSYSSSSRTSQRRID